MATSAHVIAFDEATFRHEVLESPSPVLVDFSATWCPPCRHMTPIVDALAEGYLGRAVIGSADIDTQQHLAEAYGVTAVPTFLFFKGGKVRDRVVGAAPRRVLEEKLEALLR